MPTSTGVVPPVRLLGVEVNAVMHCNLACVGCSHASPVSARWVADPDVVRRDLTALAGTVAVEEVRVVGGEPLLHPDLPALLDAIAASGLGATVRLITNGTRLHHTDWAWLRRVHEVYVSQYPGAPARADALAELARRGRELGVFVAVNPIDHFRLVHPNRPLTPDEAHAVFDTCQVAHSWSCHTVQEGYVYRCPMVVGAAASDGARCAIEPTVDLTARMREFLARPDPLDECGRCLGTVGRRVPHAMAGRRTWASLSFTGDIDWEQVAAVRADPFADNGC